MCIYGLGFAKLHSFNLAHQVCTLAAELFGGPESRKLQMYDQGCQL